MSIHLQNEDMPNLVRRLFQGRQLDALGEIVRRYYPRLRSLAQLRLERAQIPQAFYEPDDLLNSGLGVLIRLALSGRVEAIDDVDGFWRLYRKALAWKITARSDEIASRKRGGSGIRKRHRRQRRSGADRDAPALASATAIPPDDFNLFKSKVPPAEVVAISREVTARLIELLPEDHKTVVYMRLDGRTIAFMAATLGVSASSVDRMLESIRRTWSLSGLLDGIEPRNGTLGRNA